MKRAAAAVCPWSRGRGRGRGGRRGRPTVVGSQFVRRTPSTRPSRNTRVLCHLCEQYINPEDYLDWNVIDQ